MSTEEWGEQAAAVLSSDWEVRYDETSGAAYFFNVRTGESSWEAPAARVVAESQIADVVPEWTEAFDESSNRVYYVNLHTSETRWDPPPEYASGHGIAGGEGKMEKEDPRMSTAEQMEKLNRLLSGDDDDNDEEDEEGGERHESAQTPASSGKPHGEEGQEGAAPSTPLYTTAASTSHDMPWMMFLNESDGIPYYYNHVTGDCVWSPPDEFVAYHQLQEQHSEDEGCHQQQEQNFAETEAEIAQRESARSGMESTSARPGGAPLLKKAITPEFEEKVRRAIESVSKTPVGSSRVLFVRSPSEKWPEFTKSSEGDNLQDQQEQRPPGTPSESTADASDVSRTAAPSTSGRPRSSRPGSAALSSSSRPCTPQTMGIPEDAADVVDAAHTAGGDSTSDVENPVTSQARKDTQELDLLIEEPSSQLVESYDPETGTFMHVVEPLNLQDQQQEQEQNDHIESSTIAALETDRLSAMAMQLRFEEAALVIECTVRCFLARRRVQKKRATKEKNEQRLEIPQQELLAANDEPDQQEVANVIVPQGEELASEIKESVVEEETSVVAQDNSVGMGSAALVVGDQGTESSVQEPEAMIAPPDPDEAFPTEVLPIDESSLNNIETTPEPEQVLSSSPDQLVVSQVPESQLMSPEPAPLDSEESDGSAAPELVFERPTTSPGPPSTPLIGHFATESLQEQQTQDLDNIEAPTNLIQAQKADVDGVTTQPIEAPSALTMEIGRNARLPTADEKQRVSRPTSAAAATVSTSRAQSSLASAPPSTPGMLDIAQYFKRPYLKAVPEPAGRTNKNTSTAPSHKFIVRKRVETPEAKERPAAPPQNQTIILAVAERQTRKEQQMQLASVANARKRELAAQELHEFRQLYQRSAEKYKFDKQQVLNALEEEKQRLQSDEIRKVHPLSSSPSLDKDVDNNNFNRSPSEPSSSSIWELLADITSAASSRDSETSSFQTRVSQLMDPETFVGVMKCERLREIQQRLERLQTLNRVLETQLEGIDICLLHEDHFQHDEHSETNNATSKQSFQAKYASKLRRKQIELLRAIQFWQQQVASYGPSSQRRNAAPVDEGNSTSPSSSAYWDRVQSHYAKVTNQSVDNICLLRDANGDSLLHLAVWKGRPDDVAKLIKLSSDPAGMANMMDNTVSRSRPLHEACRGGHFEIARLLVAAGAMLDAVDAMGDTPLHAACRLGWTRIAHLLLTVAEGNEYGKIDDPEGGQSPVVVLSCSLAAFFNLRNYKKRRAMDLATLPSLVAFLQQYESELPQDPEYPDAQTEHAQHRHRKPTQRGTRKRSKTGKL